MDDEWSTLPGIQWPPPLVSEIELSEELKVVLEKALEGNLRVSRDDVLLDTGEEIIAGDMKRWFGFGKAGGSVEKRIYTD